MPIVNIHSENFQRCNILKVEAGTNCPQGGDWGHGGRTLLRLTDVAGTNMKCRVDDGELADVSKIEIVMGGDSENETFIEAIKFALVVLEPKAESL